MALAALTARATDPAFVHRVLAAFEKASMFVGDPYWHYDLTPAGADWLFAPVPEAVHVPRIRLVWCLDADPASVPTYPAKAKLASWMVEAALLALNKPVRDRLVELLRTTDQPNLLRELEEMFSSAISTNGRYGPGDQVPVVGPLSLWSNGRPALLTQLLLTNPHLPLDPPDTTPISDRFFRIAQPSRVTVPRILIAVLKGHPDPLPASVGDRYPNATVNALLHGADLPPAPASFQEECGRLLRTLPAGPVREELCERAALTDVAMARAAVLDAGYLPADEQLHPAFLFLTEQWARYDALDPDGDLLRHWCAEYSGPGADQYRKRLAAVAASSGRPDPCPPPPPRSSSSRHGTAVGSWVTDYGAGSHGHSGPFGHF